jgi:hypothetical protein
MQNSADRLLDAAARWRSARGVRSVREWGILALDIVIAVYLAAVVAIVATGGFDLPGISAHRAAKPILVLLFLIPVRLVLPDRSALTGLLADAAGRARTAAARAGTRTPLAPAIADVLFALLVTRAATFVISLIVNLLVPARRLRPFQMPFEREKFFETFAAWDSGWYFDVARRGYYYVADGQSSIAFFPLYPLAMRLAAWPFGGTDRALWTAGILISMTAFAAALIVLHRLAERMLGSREAARRTVLYAAVFPFSLFLSRVYAEALFFLLSVAAVSAACAGRWRQAGLWGALATLTRPNGILVGIPLALLALEGCRDPRALAGRLLPLAMLPVALAAYCAFVYQLAGDPLAWLYTQANWGYSLGHPPWEQLLKMIARLERFGFYDYFFVSQMAPYRLFHGAVAVACLALTPLVFVRLGAPLGVYVLVSLLVPLSGNALEGVGRYASVLFPFFMVLATLASPRVHEALLIVCSLFLCLFVALFVTLHPIY